MSIRHRVTDELWFMAGLTVDLAPDGDRFGQRRPPLYTIIANILQEYPSGQIFKVNLYIIIYFFVILQRKIKIAIYTT